MKRQAVLILVMFASACGSANGPAAARVAAASPSVEEPSEPLPEDHFALHSKCIGEWRGIFLEWKRHGGGVKDSIAETRKQIADDRESRFAALVRSAWSSQDLQDARSADEVGAWPVSREASIAVAEALGFDATSGIAADCRSWAWLQGLLWDDVASSSGGTMTVRSIAERPRAMRWESPAVQQWLAYWLLVRTR